MYHQLNKEVNIDIISGIFLFGIILGDYFTTTIGNLSPNTKYSLIILASCDSDCLRQVSKISPSHNSFPSCDGSSGDCRQQYLIFSEAFFNTMNFPSDPTSDNTVVSSDSFVHRVISITVSILIIVGIVLSIAAAYWWKYKPNGINHSVFTYINLL